MGTYLAKYSTYDLLEKVKEHDVIREQVQKEKTLIGDHKGMPVYTIAKDTYWAHREEYDVQNCYWIFEDSNVVYKGKVIYIFTGDEFLAIPQKKVGEVYVEEAKAEAQKRANAVRELKQVEDLKLKMVRPRNKIKR